MENDLGNLSDQQEHIEYLELRDVWKSIGLLLTKEALQDWRTKYPVNIAVLDSGVDGNHQAFNSSNLYPQPKVIKSYVRVNGAWEADDNQTDDEGHGTFCAGVAAGYNIPSPKYDKIFEDLAQTFSNLPEFNTKFSDSSKKKIKDIFQRLFRDYLKNHSIPSSDEDDKIDGIFCAGVAAGYYIPSPKDIQDENIFEDFAQEFCNLSEFKTEFSDSSKKKIEDIFQHLSGDASENLPFVGVAPFANIISYKVKDDNNNLEEALAAALQDIAKRNNTDSVEFKDRVHIVSVSQGAHYHDGVRQALYDVLNSDVIVVAAACNMGQLNNYCSGNILFPARFGNVISVGSHNNLGQPSKFSSVGREVDFLAPGEEIWGPSTSSEIESKHIEKDEGTSISAAIVSGIVALVLAFVQKKKGLDARIKISNNPAMKKILRTMATRKEQHDEVMGYGSLKPLVVFGYGAHVLWDLWDSIPAASSNDEIVSGTTAVNSFSALDIYAMASFIERARYHSLQFTKEVKLINLAYPYESQLVLEKVSEAINNSNVEVVERLNIQTGMPKDMSFVIQFLEKLPQTVLMHLSDLTIREIFWEHLSKIAKIVGDAKQNEDSTSTLIFVERISPSTECDIPARNKVEISIKVTEKDKDYMADVMERHDIKVTRTSDSQAEADQLPCIDETIHCNNFTEIWPSKFYPRLPSLSNSVPSDEKITVAILGDAINFLFDDIKGKFCMSNNHNPPLSFTDPPGDYFEFNRTLGTLCTAIIAGVDNGIAPFVNLVYAKVINSMGQTRPESVVGALKWIEEEHKEVDIVVIPFGFNEFDSNLYKAINNLSKGKIVICAASGSVNSVRPVVTYPASYGDVISVGSHSFMFQPSTFNPQVREIDVLALGESVIPNFGDAYDQYHHFQPFVGHAFSGSWVAVACAAGVVAQILARGLQCGFTREQIANNTVARELLRQLTGNFSHNPQTGYGCLPDVSKSLLFKNGDYFKEIVKDIINLRD